MKAYTLLQPSTQTDKCTSEPVKRPEFLGQTMSTECLGLYYWQGAALSSGQQVQACLGGPCVGQKTPSLRGFSVQGRPSREKPCGP